MKKMAFITAMVMLLSVVKSYGYTQIAWGDGGAWNANSSPGDQYSLTDSAGANLTTTAGLLFQIVVDNDGLTDFASMLSDGYWYVDSEDGSTASYNTDDDRVYSGSGWTEMWSTWSSPGNYLYDTGAGLGSGINADSATGVADGTDFYIRWFNGSSSGASEAGIIYNSGGTWVTGSSISPTTIDMNYASGDANLVGSTGSFSGTDGWATMAPIPEPGTMWLMGVGAAAMLARKRRKQ